jgi:hypothetical protein
VTPEAAVDRAFWSVKAPSIAAMIGPWLAFAALGKFGVIPSVGYAGLKWFLPVFIGGFLAGWLIWSVQVPRWRRWAYERVEDIEELKAHAVAAQLIWPDGHFFAKTEIASHRLRDEIRMLERKNAERRASARPRVSPHGGEP